VGDGVAVCVGVIVAVAVGVGEGVAVGVEVEHTVAVRVGCGVTVEVGTTTEQFAKSMVIPMSTAAPECHAGRVPLASCLIIPCSFRCQSVHSMDDGRRSGTAATTCANGRRPRALAEHCGARGALQPKPNSRSALVDLVAPECFQVSAEMRAIEGSQDRILQFDHIPAHPRLDFSLDSRGLGHVDEIAQLAGVVDEIIQLADV